MHQTTLDESNDEDYSETWCPRLGGESPDYSDCKAELVRALAFTCKEVFEKSPQSINNLEEKLSNKRWRVFKRLLEHLYALYPSKQNLPNIRKFILEHQNYNRWGYPYELQQMIRCACEHFGAELLSMEERKKIFDAVLSGPSKDNFKDGMGDQFTEEMFQKRRRSFHRMQLNPFSSLLFDEYSTYFQELEAATDKTIGDEDYRPISDAKVGFVSEVSPKSPAQLKILEDEELLLFINHWEGEEYLNNDLLTVVNLPALAKAFQTVFKESIIPDTNRLQFWVEHLEQVKKPIYAKAMMDAIQEYVKGGHVDNFNNWLTIAEWVLSHPDESPEPHLPHGNNSEYRPRWHGARRAVGDFVETCVDKDVGLPTYLKEPLLTLLETLCTQPDWHLDQNQQQVENRKDHVFEGINTARGRALEALIEFGFWVRRQDPQADISAILKVLGDRLTSGAALPLTLPEHALLGRSYFQIYRLDENWLSQHKSAIFPQDTPPKWFAAFGAFLFFNRPSTPAFKTFLPDYEFALKHVNDLNNQDQTGPESTDILGQHLFNYYLWDLYSLTGANSFLEQYYDATENQREKWGNLFDYIGRGLRNTKEIDQTMLDRIINFFEWRFDVGNETELQHFANWLEAECLEPEWRLQKYLEVLDSSKPKDVGVYRELKTLRNLVPSHPGLVFKCFATLTASIPRDSMFYLDSKVAKDILQHGLHNSDQEIRKNAESARDNLIRGGRFEILDQQDRKA